MCSVAGAAPTEGTPAVDPATAITVAVLMIPNGPTPAAVDGVHSSSGNSSSSSTRSGLGAATSPLHITRTTAAPFSSANKETAADSSTSARPSSGLEMVSGGANEGVPDVESGGGRASTSSSGVLRISNMSEEGVNGADDSLLGVVPGNSGNHKINGKAKNTHMKANKPKGVSSSAQTTAALCTGVFSFSVPYTSLAGLAASSHDSKNTAKATFGPASSSSEPSSSPSQAAAMTPTELLVVDPLCYLYNSQEIFGLSSAAVVSSSSATEPATTSAPPQSSDQTSAASPPKASAAALFSTGGRYVEEDCVVCLTDPKEIALLPCRFTKTFNVSLLN